MLNDKLMKLLEDIQSALTFKTGSLRPAYAEGMYSFGCTSRCAGDCTGDCTGNCSNSCYGSCEDSCSGTCETSCDTDCDHSAY